MISPWKWRIIFYVDISTSFPYRIPEEFSTWKFPSCFLHITLKMAKCNTCISIKERSRLCESIPVILRWIKKLPNSRKFLSQFNKDLDNSPEFPNGWIHVSLTTRISAWIPLHQQPPSPGIPRRILGILPAGNKPISITNYEVKDWTSGQNHADSAGNT